MNLEVIPIRSEREYEHALVELGRLWGAAAGTPERERLDLLATLIDAYEVEHHPVAPPATIEAVGLRREPLLSDLHHPSWAGLVISPCTSFDLGAALEKA